MPPPSLSSDLQSPYRRYTAQEWGDLQRDETLCLTEEEIINLRGRGETVSLKEVEQIYLPLSRLLSFYVLATKGLFAATNEFLGREQKVPYIIGVAGSVAVGKSTTSRILREMLARWQNHPKVQLVTTDGFLYPNAELENRGLMERKGFPESFDRTALRAFLTDVKSGKPSVEAPVYSHIVYDVVPDEKIYIDLPDILIVEGLNVLQLARIVENSAENSPKNNPENHNEIPFISDFFDFSIYIDAQADAIRDWYVARFLELRNTAFIKPGAYFSRYANLDDEAATRTALGIWKNINQRNLEQNIMPTRGRADLILHKNRAHQIDEVRLRKI